MTPSNPSDFNPPAVDHDVLARRRDHHGNRLPSRGVYDTAIAGELPLNQSEVADLLDQFATARPLHAAWLRYFYNEKLHPAHVRYGKVVEEERAEFLRRQNRYRDNNQEVREELRHLDERRKAVVGPLATTVDDAEAELRDRHNEAARSMSRAGFLYSPDDPGADPLLVLPTTDHEETADRLNLPHYAKEGRWHLLPWPIALLFTLVVGLLIGVSLGVVGGFFEPDNLQRRLAIVGFSVLVGVGVAVFSRYAVMVAFKLAGEATALGYSYGKRAIAYGLASLVLTVIFVSDMFVERQGILKLAQINNSIDSLGGVGVRQPTPEWIYYIVAAVVMLGYLVYSSFEGFIKGRRIVIDNRLRRESREERERLAATHRSRTEVQEAFAAVASVRESRLRIATLRESLREADRPFIEREAEISKGYQSIPVDLEPHQLHRIQDAYDNLQGAQKMFDARVEYLIKTLEPHSAAGGSSIIGRRDDLDWGEMPTPTPVGGGIVDRVRTWFRQLRRKEGPYVS